jgi:endonuclease YncB( thermonuclease family)
MRPLRHAVAALALCLTQGHAFAAAMPFQSVPIIVDGDTLRVDGMKLRLSGPDAPERFHPRCENELVVALRAKERLRELVGDGTGVTYERLGADQYGRTLANVYSADGRNVGEVLIREGLALRWRPSHAAWLKRARHWCPGFTGR